MPVNNRRWHRDRIVDRGVCRPDPKACLACETKKYAHLRRSSSHIIGISKARTSGQRLRRNLRLFAFYLAHVHFAPCHVFQASRKICLFRNFEGLSSEAARDLQNYFHFRNPESIEVSPRSNSSNRPLREQLAFHLERKNDLVAG